MDPKYCEMYLKNMKEFDIYTTSAPPVSNLNKIHPTLGFNITDFNRLKNLHEIGKSFRDNEEITCCQTKPLWCDEEPVKNKKRHGSGQGDKFIKNDNKQILRPFCTKCSARPYVPSKELEIKTSYETSCRKHFGCKICSIKTFSSLKVMNSHSLSKQHIHNSNKVWTKNCFHIQNKNPKEMSPKEYLVNRSKSAANFLACKLCNISLNSENDYQKHLLGKKHNGNLLKRCVKLPIEEDLEEETVVCDICHTKMLKSEKQQHELSYNHCLNFQALYNFSVNNN